MKTIYLFLLRIIICSTSDYLNARQSIWEWWHSKASVLKPINCQIHQGHVIDAPENVKKLLPKIEQRVILQSRPCHEKEQKIAFYFKGKVVNDKFEGPGKLKLNSPFEQQNHQDYNVCIDLQNGNTVVEVVGNFENGTLHGHGKLVTLNGQKIISEFDKGKMKGFQRYFDESGTLSSVVETFQDGSERIWSLLQNKKYLSYKMTSGYFQPSGQAQPFIVIPENETEEILVGTVHEGMLQFISDVHSVDLQLITDEYCTPKIQWKIIEKQTFDFQLTGKKLYHYEEENGFCKGLSGSNAEEENLSVFEKFPFMTKGEVVLPLLYKIKPETSPVQIREVKQKFLSNIVIFNDANEIKVNMSVWNGPQTTWRTHAKYFSLNQDSQLHGFIHMAIEENYKTEGGMHEFLNWTASEITGIFKNGALDGRATIRTIKHQLLVATFQDGVLHGPAFVIGTTPILDDMEERGFRLFEPEDYRESGTKYYKVYVGTGFFGRFKNGQVDGNFWINMIGNGWVHGKPNHEGLITGPEIAYIYPDGVTAFKGDFENRFMKQAYNVDVIKYGCDEYGMVKVEQFTPPLSNQVFSYDPCTNDSFGGGSRFIQDPYEQKTVALGPSSIPNSGEGVILKRDVPTKRIVCMYSLYLYTNEEYYNGSYSENHKKNLSKSIDYRRECTKYSLSLQYYKATISLPPEYDVNPLPNLGPKVNHHFTLNNAYYHEMEHPRWGFIQSVKTNTSLKAGDELFTYYGYDLQPGARDAFPNDHKWYFDAMDELKKVEKTKKKTKKKKKLIKNEAS